MKTINIQSEIETLFNSATDHKGAFATCRLLPGKWEQQNLQEWAEECEINGIPAKIYYLFENKEATCEAGGDMAWDTEHVSHIMLAEKDEDGDFDTYNF